VDEDELDVREIEEARLDRRGHDHEQREDGDDPELADAEDEIDEPARVGRGALSRRAGAHLRSRHHAAASICPVAAATIVSSDASACANSATSRPSRITRILFASRSTSGSSDEMTST